MFRKNGKCEIEICVLLLIKESCMILVYFFLLVKDIDLLFKRRERIIIVRKFLSFYDSNSLLVVF